MGRNVLIAAVLVPLVCFLLFKFQDGDFTLMIYEKIGQDPAVALRGKVVWITGASSGIGEYLAYELVKYGCKLVLSARRKAELERVKKNCAGMVKKRWQNGFALKQVALVNARISAQSGRVEKTDPRSADYPLTPTPRTTLWATPRTTLRTTPTDYPKKSTKFLLRGRKIQEAYLFFLHDHNCTNNSRHFLFRNFSTQSISFSSHSSPASCQNFPQWTIGKRC